MQLSSNTTYTVPAGFTARITLEPVKPTIAPGYNPQKLTVEQVGAGYRLLDIDEVDMFDNYSWPFSCRNEVEILDEKDEDGWDQLPWPNMECYGYRVPLSWVHPSKRETPSPIAAGRNLHSLTEKQVEVEKGWRLLTEEEFEAQRKAWGRHTSPLYIKYGDVKIEGWVNDVWNSSRNFGHDYHVTYRTNAPAEKTPEQILADWITTYDVKVGDLVRVTGKVKERPWVSPGMDEHIGQVHTINRIPIGASLSIELDGYFYSPLDLEKVTKEEVPLEIRDWEDNKWWIRPNYYTHHQVTGFSDTHVYSGSLVSYSYRHMLNNNVERSRDLQNWSPCSKTIYTPTPAKTGDQVKDAEDYPF